VQSSPSPPSQRGSRDATPWPAESPFQEKPDQLPASPYEPTAFHKDREAFPVELPGAGITTALVVLLIANIVLDVVSMVAYAAVRQLHNEEGVALDVSACLQLLVYIPTVVVFCIWMHRSYKNLLLFGVRDLSYSPAWAAGAFFVPILNLFRPCQIALEMWRASDPGVAAGESWRESPGSAVIGCWWASWIISGILGQILFRINLSGAVALEDTVVANMVADTATIAAGLFAILMTRELRARQEQKFQTLFGR
jgi:hypothetical protein